MQGAAEKKMVNKTHFVATIMLCSALALTGCGTIGDAFDKLPDAKRSTKVDDQGFPIPDDPLSPEDQALLDQLAALRKELQKRSGRLTTDLAQAKRELARRQAAGEISEEKVNQSPADIRDAQLDELEALKAELAKRREAADVKQQIISTSLVENEAAYASIDQCLQAGSNFTNAFAGRTDLDQLVDESNTKVYRSADRTLLLLASKETCDVSFSAASLEDYTVGLQHILEQQGGVVERKSIAGLTVLSVAHPRGNFRLASGRKVIGNGGNTNLYTTISIVKG